MLIKIVDRICIDDYTGHRYNDNSNYGYSSTYTVSDVMGTLLNMNQKSATFYKNGVDVGTAVESCHLTDDIYYLSVSLFCLGDEIMRSEISSNC